MYKRASRAYAAQRWEAAAEYAREALARVTADDDAREQELLCVRGEALLRAGHPREALQALNRIVEDAPADPHRPQALYSGALAREALGDTEGARAWRQTLSQEFPDNPWTQRLRETP
jgi:predicted Zn-dependent protease